MARKTSSEIGSFRLLHSHTEQQAEGEQFCLCRLDVYSFFLVALLEEPDHAAPQQPDHPVAGPLVAQAPQQSDHAGALAGLHVRVRDGLLGVALQEADGGVAADAPLPQQPAQRLRVQVGRRRLAVRVNQPAGDLGCNGRLSEVACIHDTFTVTTTGN